jgi:hypothetical protein
MAENLASLDQLPESGALLLAALIEVVANCDHPKAQVLKVETAGSRALEGCPDWEMFPWISDGAFCRWLFF